MQDEPLIKTRSRDNAKMLPYWLKVQAFTEGEDSVLAGGVDFLPMLPGETSERHAFRLRCAKFTAVYADIVDSLAAKPFEEEIKIVGDAIPEEITEFVENVDGDGNNLTVLASQYFYNGINDAIAWLCVDYPNPSETIRTRADARAARLRPFWSIILAKNVLEARVKTINGDTLLSYVRVLEPGPIERVREFERSEIGTIEWRLHKIENGIATIEESGTLSIDVIPFVPFITGRRDGKTFYVVPPLKGAVSLQGVLYRQESALEYAKSMTAFPMLSASGVKPQLGSDGKPLPINVGPQTVLYAPKDGDGEAGSWSYIEPNANSLKFLADDVKETKQDLRELGKQPLTAQAGLTVITTAYAAGKSRSAVKQWGLALKDAIENALVITAKWLNLDYDPEISVYDDYDDLTEEDFTSVMELRKNGDISQETVWTEAKRRGILSAEFDPELEAEKLLAETPSDGLDEFDETPPEKEPFK